MTTTPRTQHGDVLTLSSSSGGRGPVVGRFAPSPTGDLHLGNLRTALVAWLSARAAGGEWIVRMEDLDRHNASAVHEAAQLDAMSWLGLDWDGEVVRQSERFDRYHARLDDLRRRDLLFPCYCTRREIRDAVQAPHGEPVDGVYPGTCRTLSRTHRERFEAEGRRPAWRLHAAAVGESLVAVDDRVLGSIIGYADDVVLQRNDGVPAYHLAVVVDDAAQAVTEVVRADDLASATPRQVALQRLLDLPTPEYGHVPLVVGADGERLAKRHGAVTVGELRARGAEPARVRAWLARSLGLPVFSDADIVSTDELLASFSWNFAAQVGHVTDDVIAGLLPRD